MLTFKTIRQTAATGIMTEHYLRLLVAEGRCPEVSTLAIAFWDQC